MNPGSGLWRGGLGALPAVCVIGQLTDGCVLGLQRLRRRLLRDGHDIEYFHATVNKSAVRAEAYRVLTDTATPAKILAGHHQGEGGGG
jgi:hypothetical protein